MQFRLLLGSRVFPAIAMLLVACIAVGIAFLFPLSSTLIRIVKLSDAPNAILLRQGVHLTQRAHLSVGEYSSIAVFSNDQSLAGRAMRLIISDHKGTVIAWGNGVKTSYRPSANAMRIEIPMSRLSVQHDEFYTIDLSFSGGDPLSLRMMPRDKNLPAVSKLSFDGVAQPAILSLNIMKVSPTLFGMQQGVLIGAAFALGAALVSLLKGHQKKMRAAVCLIIFFAPFAVMGYWLSYDDLGIADWDYYIALHDSYRNAILQHHTFPFWDPYPCGGTAGLADPEFPLFSPTFLLEFIFGVPQGIKLAIILSIIVGATGMLALGRSLGRSVEASLIASLVVAFGTVNLLEVTEGHVNIFAAMWIPWIFWSWLEAYRGNKKPIVCGIFLALTFLAGGIYLLMYTALAFIGLLFLVSNFRKAIRTTVTSALWALGLSAFKLIPVLFWLDQFPDDGYIASTYTLPWIVDILFGRHLHGSYIIANQDSGWHEYGAYVGYGVLALALIGAARIRKSRILRGLVIATVVSIIISTLGPQLQPIFDHLWFFPRSNISRFILFAVIPMGLLAAYGADRIAKLPRWGRALRIICVGIIAIDIISISYQISEQAFVLPHVVPAISPAPYPIAFTPDRFDPAGQGSRTTRSVDAYMAGYGTMVYCSVLGPKPAVRTIYDEGGSGAVMALEPGADVKILSWNYNTVRVHIDTPKPTRVVLNTNYANGWIANGEPAIIESNRVAASVLGGSHNVTFQYHAPGFPVGIAITIAILCLLVWLRMHHV